MDVLLLEDRSAAVEFYPPVKPASATLSVYAPGGGTALESPAVTVDSLARTLTAVTSTDTFTAATGSGTPVVGRQYWMTSVDTGAHRALVRLAQYASNVWKIEAPFPGSSVQVGDTLAGARLSATVTTTSTANRGSFYQLVWTVTDADSVVRIYQQTAHVVRTVYRDAVTTDECARYISRAHPNLAVGMTHGQFAELARLASERTWRRVRAGDRWMHLFGDSAAFASAGICALRIELAREQVIPSGVIDPGAFIEEEVKALDREIADAISAQWYDANDDGGVQRDDEVRTTRSTQLVRV